MPSYGFVYSLNNIMSQSKTFTVNIFPPILIEDTSWRGQNEWEAPLKSGKELNI